MILPQGLFAAVSLPFTTKVIAFFADRARYLGKPHKLASRESGAQKTTPVVLGRTSCRIEAKVSAMRFEGKP
jgi:hypothetical protein